MTINNNTAMTGTEKAIKQLGESLVTASKYVDNFTITQHELDEMVTALKNGSENNVEDTNTAEFELVGMEIQDIKNTDVLYYLEEMIQMDDASEVEMNVYYDIKLTGRCKRGELRQVKKNMIDMYENGF